MTANASDNSARTVGLRPEIAAPTRSARQSSSVMTPHPARSWGGPPAAGHPTNLKGTNYRPRQLAGAGDHPRKVLPGFGVVKIFTVGPLAPPEANRPAPRDSITWPYGPSTG